MASAARGAFLSREAQKAKIELEEARKAGTAPAEVDEDGKEINPHIPEYMRAAPWYLNASAASGLKHQKSSLKTDNFENTITKNWYRRGTKVGPRVTKYRKGACTNCGAMTHKTKDCTERPRKKGAKYTGKNFKDDELVEELDLNFDAKRDAWNGYDPSMHSDTIKRFEVMEGQREALRRKNKEEAYKRSQEGGAPGDDDEDKETEATGPVGAKQSTGHQRGSAGAQMSVRNLRIREDTAKYLINLDPGSAFYDPKTRSMRANPFVGTGKEGEELYMGDNFERKNGDARHFDKLLYHTYGAYEKGQDVHMESMPTQAEKIHKDFVEKKEMLLTERQKEMLEKYGGSEHLNAAPKELLLAENETYVEYDRRGRVVGGLQKALPKSKYDEDVFEEGHTQVWGSWSKLDPATGEVVWGYGCCQSTVRGQSATAACRKHPSGAFLLADGGGSKGRRSASAKAVSFGNRTERTMQPAASPKGASPKGASPKGASPKGASPKGPSPRGAMLPPPARVSKGAALPSPEEAAAAAKAAAAASTVVGNGDNGETEITGRVQFTKRYATYEEELAAAKAAEAEEEAAGGSKKKKKSKEASGAPNKRKMNYGEEVVGTLDPKKVAKEMKRQKKAAKRAEAEMADERARGYNSFAGDDDGDVTAEQMEAYKMSKPRWDDPLTKMTDTT